MSDDGLVIGSDGLPARKSGPWALEKLSRVERYAGTVTTAIRKKFARGLTFVDLMAGPGLCVDTASDRQTEFPGSVLRVLDTKYAFDRILAIESTVRGGAEGSGGSACES